MSIKKVLFITLLGSILCACGGNDPLAYKTWNCTENSVLGTKRFLVYVYPVKTDSTKFLFSNMHNITTDDIGDVYVRIVGSKITIDEQAFGNGYRIKSISGSVTAKNHQMTINYILNDGKTDITINASFTR